MCGQLLVNINLVVSNLALLAAYLIMSLSAVAMVTDAKVKEDKQKPEQEGNYLQIHLKHG